MPKLEISKVHDAYREAGECPLCTLAEWAEETYLRSFEHSRVMEPSVRVQTNRSGFCAPHYRKLYQRENKLGLGLMVHTHLRENLPSLRAALDAIRTGTAAGRKGSRGVAQAAASLAALHERCFICDLLSQDMDRYAFTILYLWRRDAEFPAAFRASRGFCLPHFLLVLEQGRIVLRADRLARWLDDCVPLMAASLDALERDLLSFTQLYHDSNRGLGSAAERTALSRTLQKLAGGRFHLE